MYKFDSETFIKEIESLENIEETPLDYEEFEEFMKQEQITERDLRNDI